MLFKCNLILRRKYYRSHEWLKRVSLYWFMINQLLNVNMSLWQSHFWTESSSKKKRRSMCSRDLTAHSLRSSNRTMACSCIMNTNMRVTLHFTNIICSLIVFQHQCNNVISLTQCSVLPCVTFYKWAGCLWWKTSIWNRFKQKIEVVLFPWCDTFLSHKCL